jgi:quinoprotein glucose dehydrogenase
MAHGSDRLGPFRSRRERALGKAALAAGALVLAALLPSPLSPQQRGNPDGEWRYWGGDAWSTRFSPLEQINAQNFDSLRVAWVWRGDNFGPDADPILRSTPIYARGKLYTVAGSRRTVVAIDPATGETLWTFREPHTPRWDQSSRQNYGKGVAYAEVDGRGVIYAVTPAFFLHALDAETGRPLEGFGRPVPVPGFGQHGTVDMMAFLRTPSHDPAQGIPPGLGSITNSSPPIVVNGVVIVGSSAPTGLGNQSRIDNIPGDILAFDAKTGAHKWTFHVIPRPGELGHETWESDAWQRVGNVNAWAPLSADVERGVVYVPTDAPTNDVFGGFRPGNNLFGSSILALDVQTGRRVWHFQTVHHDIWDYDAPYPPILFDRTVNGQRVPSVVQVNKQNFAYTFNRETGAPTWPIEERPVPQSTTPGEKTSPTKPAPWDIQGLGIDGLVDLTPDLRARATEAVADILLGPLYLPAITRANDQGKRGSVLCPGLTGGTNIIGGPVLDPEAGVMYVASVAACSLLSLVPGSSRDDGTSAEIPGTTVSPFIAAGGGGLPALMGIPLLKPPYGKITAIDMNTGEHLWWIPNGDTPDRIKNNPALAGVTIPNTGQPSHATALVTRSLLMYGEGRSGRALFHAVNKRTGEHIGTVELPAQTNTAPMTFLHEGKQYIVAAIGSGSHPGSLVALALP